MFVAQAKQLAPSRVAGIRQSPNIRQKAGPLWLMSKGNRPNIFQHECGTLTVVRVSAPQCYRASNIWRRS